MPDNKQQRGFSLIELMVVVVMVAILAGLGLPSLRATMDRNAISSEAIRLARSLSFARSQAVNKQQVVTLERKSATNNDWSAGWTIYVDVGGQGNQAFNAGDGDILIQDVDITSSGLTILADTDGDNWISFSGAGRLMEAGPVAVAVCDLLLSDRVDGSLVTVNLVGRTTSTTILAAVKAGQCTPP